MKAFLDSAAEGLALSADRRSVLKAAVAGVALGALPASRVFAAAVMAPSAPNVAMGFLKRGSAWMKSATSAVPANDSVIDASTVAASPATYELRVIKVCTGTPLAMLAQYGGGAEHGFWQSWSEKGMLQHSSPVAIRWWANNGNALPLTIRMGGANGTTQVTAQAGTYVLAVGPNAQPLPDWSTLALHGNVAPGTDLKLITRKSGLEVAFPYAIFSVVPA